MARLNEKTARTLLERVNSIWDGTSTEDPQDGLHQDIKTALAGETIAEAETGAEAKKGKKAAAAETDGE